MEDDVIVETAKGKIKGYAKRGVIKFKGIPYAEPPIGDLRFQSPVPARPWSGVREAIEFSPIAPQPNSTLEAMFGEPLSQDEAKCLTLNIWTSTVEQENRPVMVFIHGGGFQTGSGAGLDGSRLVLRGDVVVVSMNYRLGALGFLYMPDESLASVNVGLQDTVCALGFIKENVSKFGGDPDNITIFGESAGSFAIAGLLAMPSAKGLFKRAIMQSGAAHRLSFNADSGNLVYEQFLEKLNIKKGDIQALRSISAEKLIEAQISIMYSEGGDFSIHRPLRLGPAVDGDVLPVHPLDAIRQGYAKEIDILIGSNKDEARLWSMMNPKADELDKKGLLEGTKRVLRLLGKDEQKADELVDLYTHEKKTPREIMDAILTEYTFRIPSIRSAESQCVHNQNTYMYLFSWESPFKGGKYGAMHAVELAFVFGILLPNDVGIFPKKTEETQALSDAMMDTWISFSRNGDPNNDNIPRLSQYDDTNRATILFDSQITAVNDPYSKERTAWNDLL